MKGRKRCIGCGHTFANTAALDADGCATHRPRERASAEILDAMIDDCELAVRLAAIALGQMDTEGDAGRVVVESQRLARKISKTVTGAERLAVVMALAGLLADAGNELRELANAAEGPVIQ